MQASLRVLVVSDNLLTRAGLAALLDSNDELLVAGQIAPLTATQDVELYHADIILYDLGWQPADHVDTLRTLCEFETPIVALLADDTDAATILSTLNTLSLYGMLLSENEADILMIALQTVANGLVVIDPALTAVLNTVASTNDELAEPLTPREDEVLQLLAQGLTNKGIAHQLGITDHTVKFHVNAIMTKLNAQSRTEAVVKATRAGLIIL
ncbi:MAG: response regulator transcription factor [Chloroflexota bacterium]